MRRFIGLLLLFVLVSSLSLSVSAVELSHSKAHYENIGAGMVIRAEFDESGKFLSCDLYRVDELQENEVAVDSESDCREFTLSSDWVPIKHVCAKQKHTYTFINEWQVEECCDVCGDLLGTQSFPDYKNYTKKTFDKLTQLQKIAIENEMGETLYGIWVHYLIAQQEAIEFGGEV